MVEISHLVHHGDKCLVGWRVEDLLLGLGRIELGCPGTLEEGCIGQHSLGALSQVSRTEDVLNLSIGGGGNPLVDNIS